MCAMVAMVAMVVMVAMFSLSKHNPKRIIFDNIRTEV